MVQLITFLLVVAALVILVLQNLTPVLPLVVLGQPMVALPFSLWLLGAIAIGVLCTLVIYQLVPKKRSYRPMGKRISNPVTEPEPTNRFVDSPNESSSNRVQQPPVNNSQRQNPYDSDWENFRAPEQWEDWGKQHANYDSRDTSDSSRDTSRNSPADTIRDIESGWGDDDYAYQPRRPSYQDPYQEDAGPDIGWHGREAEQQPRTYEQGWLYGNEATDDPSVDNEPGAPQPDESEDVYDANYRVIIPPYDTKDS
ncbi:MAG: hypothetical protein F6K11_20325 [Leptolyngbya sp. SIO3F4]|nr:hypothetical protein [Leptolyngbya sp. SIO3F4]